MCVSDYDIEEYQKNREMKGVKRVVMLGQRE
jgi:hypothetical protein